MTMGRITIGDEVMQGKHRRRRVSDAHPRRGAEGVREALAVAADPVSDGEPRR